MTYQEELIFGLIRWMIKGTKYLEKYDDVNKFVTDELRFDASCYVITMVDEITTKILNEKEILDRYNLIDFEEIKELKDRVFVGTDIDYEEMFDIIKDEFPMFISSLVAYKEKI